MFLLSRDYWKVATTQKKGRGIFAKKDIEGGTIIGDYTGKVLDTALDALPNDAQSFYLMYYTDRASIFPDLTKAGIHLLNHSCTPNCWMFTYRGHTLFFALRHIFKGEELTISYLLSPQDDLCTPCTHICTCESIICHGTMHLSKERYKKWRYFQENEVKKTKPARVTYGKELPMLSSYPKSISDNPIYTLFGAPKKEPMTMNNTTLPSVLVLRRRIRETGRTLYFPAINVHMLGVSEDMIISDVAYSLF